MAVGLIALIGIVGPALILLGSRTEKHKILNTIGNDTNGYISKGAHLGPNIYFGRRIRAPRLKNAGIIRPFQSGIHWNPTSLRNFDTIATWVHFGSLLSSYGVEYPNGDVLFMADGSAYLPVHRSWILAVGVLGRFSTGPNDAVRGRERATVRLRPFPPGIVRLSPSIDDDSNPFIMANDENLRRPQIEMFASGVDWELHGITGSMKTYTARSPQSSSAQFQSFKCLIFNLRPVLQLQHLQADTLSMEDLILLSIAFLKFRENQYISLTWVSEKNDDPDLVCVEDDPPAPPGRHAHFPAPPPEHAKHAGVRAAQQRGFIDTDALVLYAMWSVELDRTVKDLILPLTNLKDAEFLSLEPLHDSASR